MAPLTSMPIIGTSANKINDKINKGEISFFNNEVSIIEIQIITVNAKNVKIKCLEKNNSPYLIFHQLV